MKKDKAGKKKRSNNASEDLGSIPTDGSAVSEMDPQQTEDVRRFSNQILLLTSPSDPTGEPTDQERTSQHQESIQAQSKKKTKKHPKKSTDQTAGGSKKKGGIKSKKASSKTIKDDATDSRSSPSVPVDSLSETDLLDKKKVQGQSHLMLTSRSDDAGNSLLPEDEPSLVMLVPSEDAISIQPEKQAKPKSKKKARSGKSKRSTTKGSSKVSRTPLPIDNPTDDMIKANASLEPSRLTSMQSRSTVVPPPVTLQRAPIGQRYARPGVVHIPGRNARRSRATNDQVQEEHEEYDPDELEAQPLPSLDGDTLTIAVEAVTRDDLEDEVHQQIISKAPVGEVVDTKATKRKERLRLTLVSCCCCIGLIAMIVVLVTDSSQKEKFPQKLYEFLVNASLVEFNISESSDLSLNIETSAQRNALYWLHDYNSDFVTTVLDGNGDADLLLEQYALATLYYSTGGESAWSENAFKTKETCAWTYFHCTDAEKVEVFDLASANLNGTLPSELVFLRELSIVNMSDNSLLGDLGPMWELDLVSLDVHGNEFEDWNIPPGTIQLTLEYLDVSGNVLMGSIPSEIYDFSSLEVFMISDMDTVTDTISTRWGELENLREFVAEDTSLTGIVPSELGNCINLNAFRLSGSVNVTGTLPDEVWLLPKLEQLAVSGLGFIMGLPSDLMSQMTTLQELDMSECRLYGTIPSELGLLTNLRLFNVSANAVLTGSLPSEIGQLSFLSALDLSLSSAITGSIPSEIGKMTSLKEISIKSTYITGQIPTEIGRLTNLIEFDANTAKLVTSIPTEIGYLTNLEVLHLFLNQRVYGLMPSEVGKLTKLVQFTASGGMEGTLPAGLSGATSLQELVLARGLMSGTIPAAYGQLYNLRKFSLDGQRFGGTIPLTFSALTNLIYFDLANNLFTGTFPVNLRYWSSIEYIRLEGNDMTGEIARSSCDLWPENYVFNADCTEFNDNCACCTICCVNGESCTSSSGSNGTMGGGGAPTTGGGGFTPPGGDGFGGTPPPGFPGPGGGGTPPPGGPPGVGTSRSR